MEDIKLTGIIMEEVTSPRQDGTRGSALYKIPIQLSESPPHEWGEIFEYYWNHPPSYSSMHRPGIASVIASKIILDGTTIEEVEKYHLDTLKLVVKETNKKYKEIQEKRALQDKVQQERDQKHKDNLSDVAGRLNFDDD